MDLDIHSVSARITWTLFGVSMRRALYEEMARLFESVASVPAALDMLYDTYTDKVYDAQGNVQLRRKHNAVATVINKCRVAMSHGFEFTEGFRGVIPDLEIDVIRAGESSGRLPQVCQDLMNILDARLAARGALVRLAYPVFLLFVIVISLEQLYVKMIPTLIAMYPVDKWTGEAWLMYAMSYFCAKYFIWLMCGIAGFIVLYIYSLPRLTGRLRVFLDRFPPYSIYRLWTGVGFLFTVSALHRANVTVRDILLFTLDNASPYLEERLRPTLTFFGEGDSLGEAFARCEMGFPDPAIIRHLKMYAELKGYDEAIHTVAQSWLSRSVKVISLQSTILSIASTCMVAFVMGVILIGFYQVQNLISMHMMMNMR